MASAINLQRTSTMRSYRQLFPAALLLFGACGGTIVKFRPRMISQVPDGTHVRFRERSNASTARVGRSLGWARTWYAAVLSPWSDPLTDWTQAANPSALSPLNAKCMPENHKNKQSPSQWKLHGGPRNHAKNNRTSGRFCAMGLVAISALALNSAMSGSIFP